MLDLKALASFIATCQHPSLTRAAETIGFAVSSLSESLKSLESELGVTLFDRQSKGLLPTTAANWLYRTSLNILYAESFSRRYTKSGVNPIKSITVDVGLPFSIGRFDQAISKAVKNVGLIFPEVCFSVHWGKFTGMSLSGSCEANIELRYASENEALSGSEPIYVDKLVLVRRLGGRGSARSDPEVLSAPILVPKIPAPLQGHLGNLLAFISTLNNLEVIFSDHHIGSLLALEAERPDATFVVPASAVAGRHRLFSPLHGCPERVGGAAIIAKINGSDPAVETFIGAMRDALATPSLVTIFEPRITPRHLRYFDLLQQTRSVTGSAKLAAVAQPAVTDQLSKLETALDCLLFKRVRSGLELTGAGDRFLQASRLIESTLTDLKLSRPQAVDLSGGRVELGILPSVGPYGFLISRVTKAVEAWRLQHPHLHLRILEEPNATLQERILQGTLDLGIITTRSSRMARFDLGSSEPLSLVANPKFDFASEGTSIDFGKLADLPLVLPTFQFGMRQLINSAGKTRGIVLRPVIEVESLSMCVSLVRESPLCTILPASDVEREIEAGELRSYIIEAPRIMRTLQIIYSAKRALTQAERDLVELLRLHLSIL